MRAKMEGERLVMNIKVKEREDQKKNYQI